MKASRAAIKTAKAVMDVEERLTVIEARLAEVERALQRLIAAVSAAAVSADKPSEPGTSKARAVRKRGR